MVDNIILNNLNPKTFAGAPIEGAPSEVFGCRVVLRKGESCLVEAASGRGKSSLCAFICGLRSDYEGEIIMADVNMKPLTFNATQLRRNVLAVMFQDLRLFRELTAVENVMLKSGLTGYADESAVRQMLVRLGLEQHLDCACATLSLGQQQRVAFVRALVQPCDFILLDEPVSHIDEACAREMAQMLRERQQRDNVGIIVTSIGYRLPYGYDRIMNL